LTRELIESKRKNIVSYVALAVSLGIAILPILSLVFPALIVSLTTEFPDETVDPFEFGVLFPAFLIANLILLGIFILYHIKKLPTLILNSIKFIFSFEVSKRVSILAILALLGVYVAFSSHELQEPDNWPDYFHVLKDFEAWTLGSISGLLSLQLHVNNALFFITINFFHNIKLVPFVASISLVLLTYLFTVQITKKRFAGLVSMTILLSSQTFLLYDTTPTYPNYWTLFYILSLYLITKRWQLSAVSYVLSIFSKPLTALFLPFTLFFTYRANILRKQKILTALSYGVIIIIGLVVIVSEIDQPGSACRDCSDIKDLWRGFGVLGFMFGLDSGFLIFLIPLILGLFILSRKGLVLADAVMLLIVGVLLSAPLSVFGGHHVYPYRLIPFIVFFAVGVGTLLSSKLAYRSKQGP